MAREIVITSVPRGVKVGRTGFQVAMQTAGLRDDLVAMLEKMAGYRHLPAGSGPNPVSYFHRIARTLAGPTHVLGRIVDAGVDFSRRSNKLAHMVILDPGDLALLGTSSPAATLLAIEGRLATTWPGGPEERRQGFLIEGVQSSPPAVCSTWQHVKGDAGWAGVIADRATRNQPTLVIGAHPTPASCHQMLVLFQEALAIVPHQKRWMITFDTTTLSMDGILWRGTYAGSPESQISQPGVLVIDLTKVGTVPPELAASDLVQIARTGRGAQPFQTPATVRNPIQLPSDADEGIYLDTAPSPTAAGRPVAPLAAALPPPPVNQDDDEWMDVPLSNRSSSVNGGAIAIGLVSVALLFFGVIAVGGIAWFVVFPPGPDPGQQANADAKGSPQQVPGGSPESPKKDRQNGPADPTSLEDVAGSGNPVEQESAGAVAIQGPEATQATPGPEAPSADARAFRALAAWIDEYKKSNDPLWPSPEANNASSRPIPDLNADAITVELIAGSRDSIIPKVLIPQEPSPERNPPDAGANSENPGVWVWHIATQDAPEDTALTVRLQQERLAIEVLHPAVSNRRLFGFLPMRFAFPKAGEQGSHTDWFTLDVAEPVELDTGPSIDELLSEKQAVFTFKQAHINVPLPDKPVFKWRETTSKATPLSVTLKPLPRDQSDTSNVYSFDVTIEVDITVNKEGKKLSCRLTESIQIEWNPSGQLTARYEGTPWKERLDRLSFDERKTFADRLRLTPSDSKDDYRVIKPIDTFNHVSHALLLEAALARDPGRTRKEAKVELSLVNIRKNELQGKWIPRLENKPDAEITLDEWRTGLHEYLCGRSTRFSKTMTDRFSSETPRPQEPPEVGEMPEEGAADYEEWTKRKEEYDSLIENWQNWQNNCNTFIQEKARDFEELRFYRRDAGELVVPSDDSSRERTIDPEIAAIDVLLGLDALLVAWSHEKELTTTLNSSLLDLLQGTINTAWSFSGEETVLVPVAEIRPPSQQADDQGAAGSDSTQRQPASVSVQPVQDGGAGVATPRRPMPVSPEIPNL
jgi:hypothetical protein